MGSDIIACCEQAGSLKAVIRTNLKILNVSEYIVVHKNV